MSTKKASKGKRQRDDVAIVEDVLENNAPKAQEKAAPAAPQQKRGPSIPYELLLSTSFDRPATFESLVDPVTRLYSVYAVYEDETRRLICKGIRSGALANKCVDVARLVRSYVDKCSGEAATQDYIMHTLKRISSLWVMFELDLAQQRTDEVYAATMPIEETRKRAQEMLRTSIRKVPLDRFGDAAFPRSAVRAFYTVPLSASTAIYAHIDGVNEPILCKVLGAGKEEEANKLVRRYRALANRQTLPHDIEFFDCEPLTAEERRAGGVGQLKEIKEAGPQTADAAHQEFIAGDEDGAVEAEKITKAQAIGKMMSEGTDEDNAVGLEKGEDGKLKIKIVPVQEGDCDDDVDDKLPTAKMVEKK